MDKTPFVISLYSGPGEPDDLDEYINPFLEEMQRLEQNGLYVDRKHYRVNLCAVSCDSPARKFCKCTKGCGGKGSCDRCIQLGRSGGPGRWIFPRVDSKLRTDESFRNRENQDHHQDKNGRIRPRSPFEKLKNLDMVRAWPLDYMHLVRNFNAFFFLKCVNVNFDFRFA